jgi:hypothetical protein
LRIGDAAAGEGETGLTPEKGQVVDEADAFGMIGALGEDLGHVLRQDPRIADAAGAGIDLQQWLQLEHPARTVADHLTAHGGGHRIGADRAGGGIAGHEDPHGATSAISLVAPAWSSRANSRSPTIAAGPLAQRPRQ